MSESDSNPVKSALRTLEIVEYIVARERPVIAQEIAETLLIPASSLSYLLTTLVDRGYLTREGRRYGPGPGLERLQIRAASFTLAERVAPLVRALRLQLNETASFFVRAGWEVEALVTETSEHALRYAVEVGSQMPLHGFSAGKAILAALPDAEIEKYLAETERTAFTPATLVSAAALRAEIEDIRKAGYARTREEHTPGIQGIGRAVSIDGKLVGAFGIAIPNVRFDAAVERRAAGLLLRTALLIEAK